MSAKSLTKRYSCDSQNSINSKDSGMNNKEKKRRVSWGNKRIKKYIKESEIIEEEPLSPIQNLLFSCTSSDMDISLSNSVSPLSDIKEKKIRTGTQLISEFENNCQEFVWNNENFLLNCYENSARLEKSGLQKDFGIGKHNFEGKKGSPQIVFLTPVREVSESGNSTGKIGVNIENSPRFCENLSPILENNSFIGENHEFVQNVKKPLVNPEKSDEILESENKNDKKDSFFNKKSIFWTKYPKKQIKNSLSYFNTNELSYLKDQLTDEKMSLDLVQSQNKSFLIKHSKILDYQQKIQKNLEKLAELGRIDTNFDKKIQISPNLNKTIESVPISERWIQTYSNIQKNCTITAFKHFGTLINNPILKELVIIFTQSNECLSVNFKLFAEFEIQDLNKVCLMFLQFLGDFLANRQFFQILQDSSYFWCFFLKFAESFEVFSLAVGYSEISVENSCFSVKGCYFGKQFEYSITYASIDIYWDIFTDIFLLLKSIETV